MYNGEKNINKADSKASTLVKKIGNTTYIINMRFSQNATETLQQKIERMLVNEVRYGVAS